MADFKGFGLALVLALISGIGRTSAVIPEDAEDQVTEPSQNSFSFQIPIGGGNVIQSDTQVSPERRMSLEDFFLNSNSNGDNNNNQRQTEPVLQAPVAQFQVQQPNPNSLLFSRDTQFPSPSGGLISRLLLARRMLRLRRIARRLTVIPRLMGLGLTRTIARSAGVGANPLSLFAKRAGEAYDPRDFVFGNKAFTYKDNNSNAQQQDANSNNDQLQQQQTRGFPVGAQPYFDNFDEGNYDLLDNSNGRGIDSYENQDLSLNPNAINNLSNEQQLLLLQQLQKYQEQLNQMQHQLNQQQYNVPNAPNQEPQNQAPRQNYENSGVGPNQQLTDKQIAQVRQLQLELLREQQLQQQELQQQLQKLQLTQQTNNLRQHHELSSVEQEQTYQNQNRQQPQPNIPNESVSAAGDSRTGDPSYSPPFNLGSSTGGNYGGGAGKTVGVGVNVGIRPPAVDIQLTKPVSPGIKPFPPLVNPIGPKPVYAAPAQPPLVPLGILPKPILNLKGRVFFGAELGKNAGLQASKGR